jgi:hypothetical protein
MTLVTAAKQRNREAREVLVGRHEWRLFLFALRAIDGTLRTSCSKAFRKLSPAAQIRREIFFFDLVNQRRNQRSPYVTAKKSERARYGSTMQTEMGKPYSSRRVMGLSVQAVKGRVFHGRQVAQDLKKNYLFGSLSGTASTQAKNK